MRFFLLLLMCWGLSVSAQNSDAYFRRLPFSNETMPKWAELMYSADPNVHEVQSLRADYYLSQTYEKTIHERNYKTWIGHVEPLLDANGRIRPQFTPNTHATETQGGSIWNPIGPMDTYSTGAGQIPVSWQCNVYTLDVCQSNPNVLYAGVEGGDLFKTVNKGLTWFPVSEALGIRTVGRVAIAPSNQDIVYFESAGNLYKTTDGAASWSIVNPLGQSATAIAIHPTNPSIVMYATYDGLYRSDDGGATWLTIYTERVWDAVFHASDPSIVYIAKKNSTANRAELFKSTNTGLSFVLKDSGWFVPSDVANADDQGALIGVTPADPNRVYVALIGRGKAADTGWIGMYKSTDAGETWANPIVQDGAPYDATLFPSLATSNMNGTGIYQGYYDFVIGVSHTDADRIWIGVTGFNQSNDGGDSWTRIGGYGAGANDVGWVHPDLQEMAVSGNDVWLSSDGGINLSQDEFATHESRKYGIYNSDFWGYGQGWNHDVRVGGRYHNGNTGYYQDYTAGNYLRLGGAEAPTGYVDPFLERQAYFSDISDVVLPEDFDGSVEGGRYLSSYPQSAYWDSESSELLFHPNYADVLYMGQGDSFMRSDDGGLNFNATYTFASGSLVFEIEQPRDNPDVLYAVVRNGGVCRIWKSTDGGDNFSDIGYPGAAMYKMEISVNPADADELWVIHANGNQVYRSANGGLSWGNQNQADLSGQSFRDIACVGANLQVLTTNQGIYTKTDGLGFWQPYLSGLPALINTLNLTPFYRDGVMRITDKGKGIWEAPIPTALLPIAEPMTRREEVYCVQDTVQFDCHSILNHTGSSWAWTFDPAPQYISDATARNPQVVLGAAGTYDVTLTVTDGAGQVSSKTVPAMVNALNTCAPEPGPGSSMEFFTSGDYAYSEDLGVNTNVLTITAWIRPDGIQGEYTGIAISEDGDAAGFNFRPGNELAYHWPGGAWWYSSGLTVPVGEWSYVAMVATPTSMKLYLNGEEAEHITSLSAVEINRMAFGTYRGWGSRNFDGLMDEMRIWKRALTREEIRELRHLTLDQAYIDADVDLLCYYQCNADVPYLINAANVPEHGFLNGGVQLNTASPAVGGGSSDLLLVNASGTFDLPNTGTHLEIPGLGITGGDLVVTRIDAAPSVVSGTPIEGYFILNNYGTNSAADLTSIKLQPTGYTPSLALSTGFGQLLAMVRTENATTESWNALCTGLISWDAGAEIAPCSPSLDGQILLLEPYCAETESTQDLCLPETFSCPGCVHLDGSAADVVTAGGTYFRESTPGVCLELEVIQVSAFGPYTLEWAASGTTITATPGFTNYLWELDGELLQNGPGNTLVLTGAGSLSVTATQAPCETQYVATLSCYGDVNGDLSINVSDLLAVLADYACSGICGPADVNGDGQVNSSDVLAILGAFGSTCN